MIMMNKSNPNSKNSFIIIFLIIFLGICGVVAYLAASESKKEEHAIKGCYYIIDDILSDTDTSLCVDGEKTVFTYMGKQEYTLYNYWYIESSFLISDEYDNDFFSCSVNKEDSNKMQCTSHNKALGSGTWVWEK